MSPFTFGKAKVEVHEDVPALAFAAAERAAWLIREAIANRGLARVMVATGNSQIAFMKELVGKAEVDWSRVDAFHMDEYVGIRASHPSSFRFWVKQRFELPARPRNMHYLDGDASDLDAVLNSYEQRLLEDEIDLAFVGFGENGHIAFNDPGVARFDDPVQVKRVVLDEKCRQQQVGEGHFPDLASVPREAITVTCSGLMRAKSWICCVPDLRKAEAVRTALLGPVSTDCPASIVREHSDATVYLDGGSASLIAHRER